MAPIRLETGVFVKKRGNKGVFFGIIQSENPGDDGTQRKFWNVEVFDGVDRDEPNVVALKSGQLTRVNKEEIPDEMLPLRLRMPASNETAGAEVDSDDDDDDDEGVGDDEIINPPSSPDLTARRRNQSILGRSTVKRRERRRSVETLQTPVDLFGNGQYKDIGDDSDDDSDVLDDTYILDDDSSEVVDPDHEEEDDPVVTPEELATADEQADEHALKRENALKELEALIGKTITVRNGKGLKSDWKVVGDIDSFQSVTATTRPDSEVGLVGVDFNTVAETEYPLVEIFLRLWPGNAEHQLEKLNVAFKERYPSKNRITLQEFFLFVACLLSASPIGYGGEKLWKPWPIKGIIEPPSIGGIMPWSRFRDIRTCWPQSFATDVAEIMPEGKDWCPIDGTVPANDEWRAVQGLINDFNTNRKTNFQASDRLTLDESMSPLRPRQTKSANLPAISYVQRKPKPLGTELKCVADVSSGVMLHLEIQRGKKGMQNAKYSKALGGTSSCTLRMVEQAVTQSSGSKDTVYGDSWFASVKTATELSKRLGVHFVGIVKTAHRRFPKDYIEETMKEWPGGTHIVLESCFGDDLLALGYKYSSKKILSFVATKGADLTSNGDPYVARFLTKQGNYKTREVCRPRICSSYFDASNTIDVHNQIRQDMVALEEHWVTHDGWFRIVSTIIGMTVTDTLLTCKFSFPTESIYSKLKTREFVSSLAYQLKNFPFPKSSSFGRRVVAPGAPTRQWYESYVDRPGPPSPSSDTSSNKGDETEQFERLVLGRTQLKPGWCAVTNVYTVTTPDGAPRLPSDVVESHQQVKIKTVPKEDGKRPRPPQCKMCNLRKLKQKKPPFLCVECGDFFCHDVEGKAGARKCFWSHMCHHYCDSGVPSATWKANYEQWEKRRVRECKDIDARFGF
ncbi:MAG: hypothetical protein SGILL_008440 [Bacillariaceae sp.]